MSNRRWVEDGERGGGRGEEVPAYQMLKFRSVSADVMKCEAMS